ncbi:unnamed protein product [Cladocopium goreaui]|uniref:Imidazole glycerol phosphate synthase hisHF, chloroplastic (IGP synthase) (IGPS) (ImGP synthase) (Protein HISTIDINE BIOSYNTHESIS 4) n=1 Tax=Cladocopium goreaui TaxID=2562237 RepID=A0A9P1CUY9_9DINO|nr:unnamed protein product [Cladocopium goreaui]
MAQVDVGVLRAILNNEELPRRQPIVELHTWKALGTDRLNCTLVDGQNVARGVTQAGSAVQQAIERMGHQPMLLSLQRWTAQETSGTPFMLIQEASVMGPTLNRAQPHELNNLSRRAVSEVPLTQAMNSASDISEAPTQPGPVLADNIYSRPYGAPAVAVAAAPDMGAAVPGSGGILGRAPEAASKVAAGGHLGLAAKVFNAIQSLGFKVRFVQKAEDILSAERLIFPGVGAFGACVDALQRKGFMEPLRQYLKEDRPFFGICLGMQTLFESSEENPGVAGLGVLPGVVKRFPEAKGFAVPNINWSGVAPMLRLGWAWESWEVD